MSKSIKISGNYVYMHSDNEFGDKGKAKYRLFVATDINYPIIRRYQGKWSARHDQGLNKTNAESDKTTY